MTKSKTPALTGKTIAAIRVRLKLTPQQFADTLGVHLSSVYRWESSRRPKLRRTAVEALVYLQGLADDAADRVSQQIKASGGGAAAAHALMSARFTF